MRAWITAVLLLDSAVVRACRDHRQCHHSAWCDRAGSCVPCASWRWGNQSASITGSAPEHCTLRGSATERSTSIPHAHAHAHAHVHAQEEHAHRIPVEHANRIPHVGHATGTSLVLPHYVSLGLNNFKMELRRAATFAALSGRALCLPDMVDGKTVPGVKSAPVKVRMVYSLDDLKRFVALAPEAACNAARDCVHVEEHLCRKQPNRTIFESGTSAGRVQDLLYDNYGNDACLVTSGCLWSTFTLHEMYLSLWQHLAKPSHTLSAAQRAADALFQGNPYVALHWRFEESKCSRLFARQQTNATLGLCFRSPNGTWPITLRALAETVERMRVVHGTQHVLLATDGRDRGSSQLVDDFRNMLGAGVVELPVDCKNCTRANWWPANMPAITALSEVEQQLMAGARFALGSAISSWFWEVCFTMAMGREDVLAFEVAMEAEAMQHTDKNGIVPFPQSRQSLARLPFGFLGYY